ncbi:MAG: methylisocitrate lyase [Candidatus Azotimanducaceae bacterium]|jgi:methylisocitrate lyase
MSFLSLIGDEALIAPLCLDALSARVAEEAGFKLGYLSGGALGYAHAVSEALLSTDELCDVVRHVTARSNLPIIVDAGVGFGDAVHLTRAVKQFVAAGASAIEIEDQVVPKRVSHHRGIEHLISQNEMVTKINYAVEARGASDIVIIARTGAVKNESFDAACDRACAYVAAGADMILLMPDSTEQHLQLETRIPAPIVTFGALGARSPAEWRELGISLVLDPFTPQVLAIRAMQLAYRNYMQSGSTGHSHKDIFAVYNQLGEIAGFDDLYAIEDATTEKRS